MLATRAPISRTLEIVDGTAEPIDLLAEFWVHDRNMSTALPQKTKKQPWYQVAPPLETARKILNSRGQVAGSGAKRMALKV